MNSIPLSRRAGMAIFAAGALFPSISAARAQEVCAKGLVVLTVGGLVGAPNRPPFDGNRDRFFDHNNLNFQKARSFSSAELAALPQRVVQASVYGADIAAKGPLLTDVLKAVDPSGTAKTLRLSALDGYAAEIPLADASSQGWILATEANGEPLEIGGFGPLYALRQLPAGEKRTEEESNMWVHSLYYIEVAA